MKPRSDVHYLNLLTGRWSNANNENVYAFDRNSPVSASDRAPLPRYDHAVVVAGDDTLVLAGGNCETSAACYDNFVVVRPPGANKADPGETMSLAQQPGLSSSDGTPSLQYDTEAGLYKLTHSLKPPAFNP